jgi:hypothetical protein
MPCCEKLETRNTVWFNFDGFVPNVGGDMGAARTNLEAQQVHIRNSVARLAPYWNVVWNIAFEWQEFLSTRDVARIGDELRRLDPWHHLITVHDQGSFHSGAELRKALHVDFPTLQYDAGKVADANTAFRFVRQFAGNWPVYANEMTWESTAKLDADQVRRGAWGVALAGGVVNYAEMFEGANQGIKASPPTMATEAPSPVWRFSSTSSITSLAGYAAATGAGGAARHLRGQRWRTLRVLRTEWRRDSTRSVFPI